jgi:ketosteroid isomerase-like protein
MSAPEQAVRQILESWAESVRRQDIDGVLAHHAPGILMFDVVPPLLVRGLEAYRASWADQFFPWYGSDGRFDLDEVRVSAGGRVAFATGLVRCAGTEAGERHELTVRLTVCFEKRNGHWAVVHEHHSEPASVPTSGWSRRT